jgi:hypothetical protein
MSVTRTNTYAIAPLHGQQLPIAYDSLADAQAACAQTGKPGAVFTITTIHTVVSTTPHNYVVPEAPPTVAAALTESHEPQPEAEPPRRRSWRDQAKAESETPTE